jgi:AraC-like DNA-binding protein
MSCGKFATHSLPKSEQFDAWHSWYSMVCDTAPRHQATAGFPARNVTWTLNGFALSCVTTPPVSVARTKTLIRRNPVDHWAISLSKQSPTELSFRGNALTVPAGVPFVFSLAEEICHGRAHDRLQLYLARDSFHAIAPLLDAAEGMVLDTPEGKLLADYMLLLECNLPHLPSEDGPKLAVAIQAMLGTCLAPFARRVVASHYVDLTLMERVRRAVRRNLRSPSLGPDKLCREAATSRSQLYRLLEGEGGVARYIQRRRLSESFSILCDTSNNFSIAAIAEALCFVDASNFSRAFRREFGMSPSEVRAASLVGVPPAATSKVPARAETRSFADCLRAL